MRAIPRDRTATLIALGKLEASLGAAQRAFACFAEARTIAAATGLAHLDAIAATTSAMTALDVGETRRAIDELGQGLAVHGNAGRPDWVATSLVTLVLAHLLTGDLSLAMATLERIDDVPDLARVVAHARAVCAILAGHPPVAVSTPPPPTYFRRLSGYLESLQAWATGDDEALGALRAGAVFSAEGRWCVRIAERFATVRAERLGARPTLRMAWDGSWFDAGEGAVTCPSAKLRALLVLLARARREAPGRSLSNEEISRDIWPKMPADDALARNRVANLLTRLRRLGLRDLLRTNDDGWCLAPEARIILASDREFPSPGVGGSTPRNGLGDDEQKSL
jgi:hypothetical protein